MHTSQPPFKIIFLQTYLSSLPPLLFCWNLFTQRFLKCYCLYARSSNQWRARPSTRGPWTVPDSCSEREGYGVSTEELLPHSSEVRTVDISLLPSVILVMEYCNNGHLGTRNFDLYRKDVFYCVVKMYVYIRMIGMWAFGTSKRVLNSEVVSSIRGVLDSEVVSSIWGVLYRRFCCVIPSNHQQMYRLQDCTLVAMNFCSTGWLQKGKGEREPDYIPLYIADFFVGGNLFKICRMKIYVKFFLRGVFFVSWAKLNAENYWFARLRNVH